LCSGPRNAPDRIRPGRLTRWGPWDRRDQGPDTTLGSGRKAEGVAARGAWAGAEAEAEAEAADPACKSPVLLPPQQGEPQRRLLLCLGSFPQFLPTDKALP